MARLRLLRQLIAQFVERPIMQASARSTTPWSGDELARERYAHGAVPALARERYAHVTGPGGIEPYLRWLWQGLDGSS